MGDQTGSYCRPEVRFEDMASDLHEPRFWLASEEPTTRILLCSMIRRAQQMGFHTGSLVTERMHGIDAAGSPRR
jgi:hypothetical protein